jgi:hypothetical protein
MNICMGIITVWFRVQFGKSIGTSEFFKDVQNSMIPKPGHECNLKPACKMFSKLHEKPYYCLLINNIWKIYT